MEHDSSNLDLIGAFRVIRQRAPVIALCCILAAAAAFVLSKRQQRQYTAAAQIMFRNSQLDQQAAGLQVVSQVNLQPQTDTNLTLAKLPRIATETAAALGHGLTGRQLTNAVSVTQIGDTQLARISATWPDPTIASEIANEYARRVIADSQQSDANYYSNALQALDLQYNALTPAQQQGVEGADLKDRTTSLQILSQLQSGEVQLEQVATPPSGASSPRVRRNTILGAGVGLVIGLALAFLLQRLDRRLREPSDLERVYGVPLLGVIPESAALRRAPKSSSTLAPSEPEIFGLLRAHIRYFNVDRELRVIVVVSAAPGDGKTTVASNLAMAAATVGSHVLFIEADLRRPIAAKVFGTDAEPGLSEVLLGEETLESVMKRVNFAYRNGESIGLDVLVAGGVLPPNPPQVIESNAMFALLDGARRDYDFVVIDTPPLVLLPDAFPLLRQADGVLIVSRLGHNRRDVASRLRETLDSVDAPVVGVVANGYRPPRGTSAYGYGASYRYNYSHYANGASLNVAGEETENGTANREATRRQG
jgi:polysaccharide biosynthesis transport protein